METADSAAGADKRPRGSKSLRRQFMAQQMDHYVLGTAQYRVRCEKYQFITSLGHTHNPAHFTPSIEKRIIRFILAQKRSGQTGRLPFALQYWWFNGKISACHAEAPGSIPGQCIQYFVEYAYTILLVCSPFASKTNILFRHFGYRLCVDCFLPVLERQRGKGKGAAIASRGK